jgi:hypothetical protein
MLTPTLLRTEARAFNPRAVAALTRAGFKITKLSDDDNPKYRVEIAEGAEPQICFSRVYDQEPNASGDFCAVMTCSQADKACPVVKGAALRMAMPLTILRHSTARNRKPPSIPSDAPRSPARCSVSFLR